MRTGDERPHVGPRLAVADGQPIHPLGDLRDQLVGDRSDCDDRGDRHATFAGRAESRVDRGVGREIEIGVGQHHHVVLGATQRLHALARARRGLVHVAGDRSRPDERHGLHARVLE